MNYFEKNRLEEFTESEFLGLIREFFEGGSELEGDEFEDYIDKLVRHFVMLVEHPAGSDLLFYPEPEFGDSPEEVLQAVKTWRSDNGLPGFKRG